MATYAAYRHIELDKVGYSKKRVRNTPSEIFNVMSNSAPCSPGSNGGTPNRNRSGDSFNRLFGSPEPSTPRRSSLTKHADLSPRNPVTGDGVVSWDSKSNRSTPRMRKERNPVTGEEYLVGSPATTPTKPLQNGLHNGFQKGAKKGLKSVYQNGHVEHLTNGKPMTNGKA